MFSHSLLLFIFFCLAFGAFAHPSQLLEQSFYNSSTSTFLSGGLLSQGCFTVPTAFFNSTSARQLEIEPIFHSGRYVHFNFTSLDLLTFANLFIVLKFLSITFLLLFLLDVLQHRNCMTFSGSLLLKIFHRRFLSIFNRSLLLMHIHCNTLH